jgi:cell division protein FtsB
LRRLLVALGLVAAVGAWALVDRQSGVSAWLGLRHDLATREQRIQSLQREVEAMRGEVKALQSDRFAEERAIREELELARPGETVVKIPRERAGTPRIP